MNLSLTEGLSLYLILLAALSVHEWAHAYVADKLGDPTARMQGRVTLNPVAHIDPIGTVALPLIMIFFPLGFFLFGWGKPVPVDPRNLRHPRRDDILISMAGPASNLALLIGGAILFGILQRVSGTTAFEPLFFYFFLINSILIVFNLIPIPPLDGSHVLRHAINMRDETYYRIAQYGFIIIIVLINVPVFRSIVLGGTLLLTGMADGIRQVFLP